MCGIELRRIGVVRPAAGGRRARGRLILSEVQRVRGWAGSVAHCVVPGAKDWLQRLHGAVLAAGPVFICVPGRGCGRQSRHVAPGSAACVEPRAGKGGGGGLSCNPWGSPATAVWHNQIMLHDRVQWWFGSEAETTFAWQRAAPGSRQLLGGLPPGAR